MLLTWLLLAAAIAAEVCATVSLKLSEGFTRPGPSAVVVAGYLASFVLLSQILSRGMSLGVVYAVWSALGIAVIVLIDRFFFHQRLSGVQVAGLVFVVVGVAALQLGNTTT
jgi:small multidrug resistance pump